MTVNFLNNNKNNEKQIKTCSNGIGEFLSNDHLNKLQSVMETIKVKAGTFLFWEGDTAEKLYYVCSGRIKLRKSTEDGKSLMLSILNKGDLVGEYGGHGETIYSCSAEVSENAEIGVIKVKDLEEILAHSGQFAVEFMKWLGVNYRKNESKFRDLLLYGKAGALASTLIRLSNTYGGKSKDGIKLNIKLTNAELADFIGTTRESVNRLLNAWKEEGTITVEGGKIVILCLETLRSVCNCPACPVCPVEVCRI
ncbi:Crp/Fnr family transcriptional regulator [Bacillus taeanensis]|uniref:Crp/Fnr family transcriptional regulator n=1 Tax=Bacillus taeanensis TaxID=273032 RepID=A0A366XUI0_9BACI|nr:Crp/Fnr family transcriptional regulator [Bacillus taeanensis]RBW68805.1 Crp/Fnr family transcriptional regulator [Bacillus taeanensis]